MVEHLIVVLEAVALVALLITVKATDAARRRWKSLAQAEKLVRDEIGHELERKYGARKAARLAGAAAQRSERRSLAKAFGLKEGGA